MFTRILLFWNEIIMKLYNSYTNIMKLCDWILLLSSKRSKIFYSTYNEETKYGFFGCSIIFNATTSANHTSRSYVIYRNLERVDT